MKLIAVTLIFFLLAFVGLARGLLLRRRGLRGSCSAAVKAQDCRCEAELDASMRQQDCQAAHKARAAAGKPQKS